jgi:anti-sigma factor RsiW
MAELTDRSHITPEELVWFFYGEAENAAEIDVHLSGCRKCRADYEALKATLNAASAWSVPDRDSGYGERVWREIVRRDASVGARTPRFRWRRWFEPRRVAAYALTAMLLVAAFLAGRITERADAPPVSAAVVRERLLAAALSDHLEESQRTLIEITNAGGDSALNIAVEQQRAESLLRGNRLYRQAAANEGQTALATVLEDLERVLLEVAHAPGELSPDDLSRIRTRVEDQELLFRLRVLGLRLRELQEQPVRDATAKI